jgi:hypothetical protein
VPKRLDVSDITPQGHIVGILNKQTNQADYHTQGKQQGRSAQEPSIGRTEIRAWNRRREDSPPANVSVQESGDNDSAVNHERIEDDLKQAHSKLPAETSDCQTVTVIIAFPDGAG